MNVIYTSEHLDVQEYEKAKFRPAGLIDRLQGESWAVREMPLDTDLSPRYLWYQEGDKVHVPLHPYLVKGMEPPTAVGLGARLGAQVLLEAGPELVARLRRLHIIVGHPVQETPSGLRFWLGFAMLVKI